MDRSLLKATGWAGLITIMVVTVLFLFVDRAVDTAALALAGGVCFKTAQAISLLADHHLFNLWLFFGFICGGVLGLNRGLTPGVRSLLYLCVAVSTAMLLAETLKWFFGRYRPVMFFEHDLYGFSWLAEKGKMHSFPSGHTVRIFSAMTALALIWPRAGAGFLSLAVLVGVSRVLVTRHYPSDVVAGAFVGIFCALWVWRIMMKGRG